jgi:patatin-like phospholipase/acyl hydrolase
MVKELSIKKDKMNKKFNILSIDGGGIRGIFASEYLAKLEQKFKDQGKENWQIYQNFDLLAGTSTGGIIALALSLGIPAKEISDLYKENARKIFKPIWYRPFGLFKYKYERDYLEKIIKDKFSKNFGYDPRLNDCMIPTCIPIFDLQEGEPSILKTKHNPTFNRDYHLPAYMAALATSAAPTFFKPYTSEYIDLNGHVKHFRIKVDGGVFCNNPSLTAIFEAKKYFNKKLDEINLLSIGTGSQKFCDSNAKNKFGISYWINTKRKRIIELLMQGQSQQVQNLTDLLKDQGLEYYRIDTTLDANCNIELDETDSEKINILCEKASREFQKSGNNIVEVFRRDFVPVQVTI